MSVLMIGSDERERIKEVIAYAKAHPLSLSVIVAGKVDDTDVLELKDRAPGFERPRSASVIFPGGFRASFSIEQQPSGFCTHLSVGVEGRSRKGAMPHPEAVRMICEEFNVPFPPDRHWIEEYEPGEFCINLVSLYAPAQEGHA